MAAFFEGRIRVVRSPGEDYLHQGSAPYRRRLGDAEPDGAPAGYMAGFTGVKRTREPSPLVDADPAARIADMDFEGWFDALIVNQPIQHLSRAVSGVADQALGIQIEAIQRPFDHTFRADEITIETFVLHGEQRPGGGKVLCLTSKTALVRGR
jgi:hypothetical protein